MATSLFLFAAAPTAARPAEDVPDISRMAFLSGRCERMVVLGEDVSHVCRGPVYNTAYRSGRLAFAFPGGNDADNRSLVVSFSGMEQPRQGDRVQLLLDRITLVGTEEEGESAAAAEGICEFGDPSSGPMRITCAGRTQAGDFIGIFATDGKPPAVQDF